jgi:protoporphyrinogen oxidase
MEAVELMPAGRGLSRRELLAALVGSAAAAACKRKPVTPNFGGDLLGQNASLGHQLRDGFRPEPTSTQRIGVVIVGAGPSGLNAAWKLRNSAFDDFVVLELEDHPGGTSAYGKNSVSAFPWGAHYVPVPLPESRTLIELLRELNVVESTDEQGHPKIAEEHLCRAPQERLFLAGEWHDGLYPRFGASREDLAQLRAFESEVDRWVSFRDENGRRAFALPTAHAASHPELDALDQISMAEWLRRKGWNSPRLRWWIEYGCRDDYGLSLENTSAWAGLFYFAARVEKPGDKGAEFVTWPEGNGRIVRHLVDRCGAERLRTGVAVTEVKPVEGGVEVRAWDAAKQRAIAYRAEQVIFALPRFLASRLIAPWREQPPSFLGAFSYGSWMVANLTLRDRPRENSFPLAWDNVLYESKGLGYVVATHQTGQDYGPSVWTYYLPLVDGTPMEQRQLLLSADWHHWVDAILADLGRPHPDLAEKLERVDVWRWGHAMVRPVVGFLRGAALRAAREPLEHIHFAHTDLSGMALFEESQYWGVHAAEAVLTERGLPFRSSL